MRRLSAIATVFACTLLLSAGTARSEVQKFIIKCGDKLCPHYQIALTPPRGWALDARATWHNKIQMIVPQGTTFNTAPALIYVQVFLHRNKNQSLADFARISNERWRAHVKDAKISPLPTVKRANGKPDSCALPSKIRPRRSRATSSAPSALIPTRTAMNSSSTW